jgi:hypothetical protein
MTKHMVTVNGKTMTLGKYAAQLGVSRETLAYRMKHGKPLDVRSTRGRPTGTAKPSGFFADNLPYEQDRRAQIAVQLAFERGQGLTCDELAELLGVCRARADQLVTQVLIKLRVWAEANGEEEALRSLIGAAVMRETLWDEISRLAPGYTAEEYQRIQRKRAAARARRAA